MNNIIYSKLISKNKANILSKDSLKDFFYDAKLLIEEIESENYKIAYFFIDPLMDHFEASNRFFFEILGLKELDRVNHYRTGAGPIQAFSDAQIYLESGIADAVAIFTYEPLYTSKKNYGSEVINRAMDIFNGVNIISSYNNLAKNMCQILEINESEFLEISDLLFNNYLKTYKERNNIYEFDIDRGPFLNDLGGDLFRLTDIANPNIDFSAGLIISNDNIYDKWGKSDQERIVLSSAHTKMIKGNPNETNLLVGRKDNIYPHLNKVATLIEDETGISFREELLNRNLLLAAYTCFPTSPIAFLSACGFIDDICEIYKILEDFEITVEGGMSLGRAAWNNPAFSNTILAIDKIRKSNMNYALIQGNGGLGENQGLCLISKL